MNDKQMIAELIVHLEKAIEEANGWYDDCRPGDLEDEEWVIKARAKIAEAKLQLNT